MFRLPHNYHSFEVLESRIAPAAVIDGVFRAGQVGTRIELLAGEGLSTGGNEGGAYMLFVEQGRCLVFTTDLNNNGQLDYNEITGISAGDGLSLICFADIHGDIVTNLKPNGFLSDSDNNAANNPETLGGDGRILLDSRIEKIEMRSLTVADITDVNDDGVVDDDDLATRLVLSSYSIFGNIYTGTGFGSTAGGLLIDDRGLDLQEAIFTGAEGLDFFIAGVKPTIGSIKVGTAASNDYFSFGASRADNIQGTIVPFVPKPGVAGGDIINIRAANTLTKFNITSLEAGDGGTSARGGNVVDISLFGDDAGGYQAIAGDGGRGPDGGVGGAISNFADRGSVTSFVLLKSGDGGEGLTGRGGNGGTITIGSFVVTGNVNIELGNGGAGFTSGGNGASFPEGVIIAPEIPATSIGQIVSSWHDFEGLEHPATLGTYASVDFDLDGVGDYVFTSVNPGQLVVAFGAIGGGFRTIIDANGVVRFDRIYLDGFGDSEALTVGDFNGDGNPDIATGSFSVASFAGVRTFLAQYQDLDNDGDLEPGEFTGFSRGIESPVPSIALFNNGATLGDYRSAMPITDIATGDFNGDGVADIAITFTSRDILDGSPGQSFMFMMGDKEENATEGTGSFFADFGGQGDPENGIPPDNFVPLDFIRDETTTATIEALRLSTFDNHDVVSVSVNGQREFYMYDTYFGGAGGTPGALPFTVVGLGRVDVDRDVGQQNLVPATFRDLTAVDYDNDGDMDFAVILQDPTAFMVLLEQTGPGAFTIDSGTGDNAGVRLGSNGLDLGDSFVAIRVTDANGDGLFNEVALLNYSPPVLYYRVNELSIIPFTPPSGPAYSTGNTLSTFGTVLQNLGRSDDRLAFDVYSRAGLFPDYAVGMNSPQSFTEFPLAFVIDPLLKPGVHPAPLEAFRARHNEYRLVIAAGDGGGSLIGKGGTGGSLGTEFVGATIDPLNPDFVDPTGSLQITFAPNLGAVNYLVAGAGGNGFTAGGKGGNVNGVSARDTSNDARDAVNVTAGSGGFGVSGPGGRGGDIKQNSIQGGFTYLAGNGGGGRVGGTGGSILGSGVPRSYDVEGLSLSMTAGIGGTGVKRGGDGGEIKNMVMRLVNFDRGEVAGPLTMIAGAGGNSISGRGGQGGSVSNSSPLGDNNDLAFAITVIAGNGGNGIAGGHGGSISKFVDKPTNPDVPTSLTFIAGTGGSGTSGRGGNGGNVTDIDTPSTGEPVFDRILAGNGGSSSGNAGGNGGNVSGLVVSAGSGSMAIVAGAGGAGLQSGGRGGSVTKSFVTSGGSETAGKVLVIAGAGGDASAFVPNPNEGPGLNIGLKAFGGKIGRGGNGGNINGFSQFDSIDVSIDLIAGNGGSTINYGNFRDSKVFVGKGGFIKNVDVRGSIGNVAEDQPIKAYNDPTESLTEWVDRYLRGIFPLGPLNDSIGNVGIVAGAAGRIKPIAVEGGFETQPAPGATKLNGSVQNITARLLMSAVAGDVNRLAAIHVAKNINITGGLVGSDKGAVGVREYIDIDGSIIDTPVLGGGLLDGAFISDNRVNEIDGKPRVFIL
jgi:hypothetical protein